MKIQADLDPKTVWAVAETAERLGITNSELLERRLSGLRDHNIGKPRSERVREMHALNYSDADMADDLGCVVSTIASIRRGLGLLPNKRYGR